MPGFIRAFVPGGTFFFTVVTYRRQPIFRNAEARRLLREAFETARLRRPFDSVSGVLLPDHLHCIWTLPAGDADFSMRWRQIKHGFTRRYLAASGIARVVSDGAVRKRARGVWQQRFWEHTIRDEVDLRRHIEYMFYNPVKHGYVGCVHAWRWSTFHRAVADGWFERDWGCSCDGRRRRPPDSASIDATVGE